MIPAGIFEGVEAFWYNNEKWVLLEGTTVKFHDAPGWVQRMIADACRNDKRRVDYMKSKGVRAFSEVFDWWYRCVVGALDNVPDFVDGKFTADNYNHGCTKMDCLDRGKLCGFSSGLNTYDVKTLAALKKGETIRKTAAMLHVSEAGLKSRITKLRQKTEAKNTAALTALAGELGI